MEEVLGTWSWFIGFPLELAQGLGAAVIAINVVMAFAIMTFRRSPVVSVAVQWTPLALYGVAWVVRWFAGLDWVGGLASGTVSGVLLIVFSVLVVVSLAWSVVNLIRVLIGK